MTETQKGDINVGAAKLGTIAYSAEQVTEVTNVFPEWTSGNKTVTITATAGTGTFEYECDLVVTSNIAAAEGVDGATAFTDMYVSAAKVGETAGPTIETDVSGEGKVIPAVSGDSPTTIKLASGTIDAAGETLEHKFNYKLTFKDNGDQNKQQGASIAAAVTCKLSGSNGEQHFTNDSH